MIPKISIESRNLRLSVRGSFPDCGAIQPLKQRRIATGLVDTKENRLTLSLLIESFQAQEIKDFEGFQSRIESGCFNSLPSGVKKEEFFKKIANLNASLSEQVKKHDNLVLTKFISTYGMPECENNFWTCVSRFVAIVGIETAMAGRILTTLRKMSNIFGFKDYRRYYEISKSLTYKAPTAGYRSSRENLNIDRIIQNHASIKSIQWKNVYALMACYGIRNCEVYNLDLGKIQSKDNTNHGINVLKGKTGERFIPTVDNDLFSTLIKNPENILIPSTTQESLQAQGQRVTAQFRRYGVDHTPYDLRHSWCIRLGKNRAYGVKEVGLMSGHSLDVFDKVYHQAA